MIPQTQAHVPKQAWQLALSNAISDPNILLSQLGLKEKLEAIDGNIIKQFPLRVPQTYVNKMRYGDVNDPLLRQVFPLLAEGLIHPDFVSDPVGDQVAITSPGLLQKYHGRALLLTTGACAIHCRYCFRRHFPYSASNPLAGQWQQTITTLRQDSSIKEVILSGGDPLSLSDTKLNTLITELETIPHIKRLRIHSRLPVVLPDRVTKQLLTCLESSRFQIIMVIHANHANELVDDVIPALKALINCNVLLLNQSVLLKGINDNVVDLIDLSERLCELNVTPYYLHLLDPVQGASHFDVSESIGISLIQQLRQQLSGYLVPRLVREQQGQASKTIMC